MCLWGLWFECGVRSPKPRMEFASANSQATGEPRNRSRCHPPLPTSTETPDGRAFSPFSAQPARQRSAASLSASRREHQLAQLSSAPLADHSPVSSYGRCVRIPMTYSPSAWTSCMSTTPLPSTSAWVHCGGVGTRIPFAICRQSLTSRRSI